MLAVSGEKAPHHPGPGTIKKSRAHAIGGEPLADLLAEFDPAACAKSALLLSRDVVGDKVAVRDAVTVEKNQRFSAGVAEAFVKDPAFAETLVFLPEVADRRDVLAVKGLDQLT